MKTEKVTPFSFICWRITSGQDLELITNVPSKHFCCPLQWGFCQQTFPFLTFNSVVLGEREKASWRSPGPGCIFRPKLRIYHPSPQITVGSSPHISKHSAPLFIHRHSRQSKNLMIQRGIHAMEGEFSCARDTVASYLVTFDASWRNY